MARWETGLGAATMCSQGAGEQVWLPLVSALHAFKRRHDSPLFIAASLHGVQARGAQA